MHDLVIITDFDGCLTSGVKSYHEHGGKLVKQKHISDLDSTIIDRIKDKVKICILSKDREISGLFALKKRVDYVYAEGSKLKALEGYFQNNFDQNKYPEFAYLGNSLDDLECLEKAKIGFVPLDRSDFVKRAQGMMEDVYALRNKGGEGAFEEMISFLIFNQGLLPKSILND